MHEPPRLSQKKARCGRTEQNALMIVATWGALALTIFCSGCTSYQPSGQLTREDLPSGLQNWEVPLSKVDNDKDGCPDAYEQVLLQKFAPKIWLHRDENRWPVNVEWFLDRVTMRYSHPHCPDHEILPVGHVNSSNITEQTHQDTSFPCVHRGAKHRSDKYVGEPKQCFFLQFPNDSHHNGSRNQKDWVIYGHVYPVSRRQIVIQYWQLYAYNDSFGPANHEGDWEMSGLLIDEDERPIRVFHYRHGHVRDISPSEAEWEGDHHISYSSKGGHGQYPRFVTIPDSFVVDWCDGDGLLDEAQGFADNCNQGTAWDTWSSTAGGIVNVGEKKRPLSGANWIRYSGLWGEIGTAHATGLIDFTSGPQGPAYQNGWDWKP